MGSLSVLVPSRRGGVVFPYDLGQVEVLVSGVVGRGAARNDLACRAVGDYFLFVDDDVILSKSALYIIEVCIRNGVSVAYDGGNGGLCSRVLGVSRKRFFEVGGFDERFDVGEDLEFGYRLKSWVPLSYKLVSHVGKGSFSLFKSLLVRARCFVLHRDWRLVVLKRKFDILMLPLLWFMVGFYLVRDCFG